MSEIFPPKTFSGVVIALAVVSAFAGCSKAPETAPATQAAPQEAVAVATPAGMTTALTQEQVGARYLVSADPVLEENGEVLQTVVSVTNTGKVAINSQGTLPVNLAISLIDSSGNMVTQEFVRAPLPVSGIPAGGSADVITEVPANAVIGKRLRFGLVQEGVAWFSGFKVEPLDYGPFTSCEEQGKPTVCGKDGKPLVAR